MTAERYRINVEFGTRTCRGCGSIHNPLKPDGWSGQHLGNHCWVAKAENAEREQAPDRVLTLEPKQAIAFLKQVPGRVFMVAALTGNTSEWVQVVKGDLVARLTAEADHLTDPITIRIESSGRTKHPDIYIG